MAGFADGSVVCAHHFEFDAGVILRELRRCGLDELAASWGRIAKSGYCTMNRDLGGWMLPQVCEDEQRYLIGNDFLSLKTVSKALRIPDSEQILAQHHNAEADAEAACKIYATVLRRSEARQPGAEPTDSATRLGV